MYHFTLQSQSSLATEIEVIAKSSQEDSGFTFGIKTRVDKQIVTCYRLGFAQRFLLRR